MTLTRRQTLIGAAATVAAAALPAVAEAECPGDLDTLRSHWERRDPGVWPAISSLDDGWQHHPVPCAVHVQSATPFRNRLISPSGGDVLTTSFGIQIFAAPGYEQMNREQLADLYRIVKSAEFAEDPVGAWRMQEERRFESFRSYGWDV